MSEAIPDMESIVRTLIAGGESHYVEFKSAWHYGPDGKAPRDIKDVARDIGTELVAFANAEGGDLLVGGGGFRGPRPRAHRTVHRIEATRAELHRVHEPPRVGRASTAPLDGG